MGVLQDQKNTKQGVTLQSGMHESADIFPMGLFDVTAECAREHLEDNTSRSPAPKADLWRYHLDPQDRFPFSAFVITTFLWIGVPGVPHGRPGTGSRCFRMDKNPACRVTRLKAWERSFWLGIWGGFGIGASSMRLAESFEPPTQKARTPKLISRNSC